MTRIRSMLHVAGLALTLLAAGLSARGDDDAGIRLGRFDVDATPPPGIEMAYRPADRPADLPLRCRGLVIVGAGEPIVAAAIDWIGLGNEGYDDFRAALAAAAGTRPDRVAVHALHQHDAPYCDFTAGRLLAEAGVTGPTRFMGPFQRDVIARAAAAVTEATAAARPVTHWGAGRGRVTDVASNRRILGPDGRVRAVRWSTTREPAIRDEPEGLIDPFVSALGFWQGDDPVAVVTSYACHPQSYYGTRTPSPDFPGIARFIRTQDLPAALHVHFDGAGGNVTAGKYNDGAPSNRMALALRLAAGMRAAYESIERRPLAARDVGWSVREVRFEPAAHLDEAELTAQVGEEDQRGIYRAASQLAWLRRCRGGHPIPVGCLRVGDARMLFLPGELFVEYQLAAQRMRPDLHVLVAAYGNVAMAYFGTAVAYTQGGYETEPRSSFVGPRAEPVLLSAIESLLVEGR